MGIVTRLAGFLMIDNHAFLLLLTMSSPLIIGHNVKWDHFKILDTGKSHLRFRIKETLLTSDLKLSLDENVGSEKLFLY